jgi:hypothetical protein
VRASLLRHVRAIHDDVESVDGCAIRAVRLASTYQVLKLVFVVTGRAPGLRGKVQSPSTTRRCYHSTASRTPDVG